MSDLTGNNPDETVPYVRGITIYEDAEDVKTVEFTDGETTVHVGITDEILVEFVTVAEDVFDRIHADMAEMNDILDQAAVGADTEPACIRCGRQLDGAGEEVVNIETGESFYVCPDCQTGGDPK